jgi:hypothetical protein
MSKSKINLKELEQDIDKILAFVDEIDHKGPSLNNILEKAKEINKEIVKKYKDNLDIEK